MIGWWLIPAGIAAGLLAAGAILELDWRVRSRRARRQRGRMVDLVGVKPW